MNSFLKTILSTVASSGLQAIGRGITDGIFPPQQAPAEATGSRAPPTGLSGFFEQIKGAFSSVTGLVTNALKDSAGFIQSLFIRETPSSDSLSPALADFYQAKIAEIELDANGNPYRYRIDQNGARIDYAPSNFTDGVTAVGLDGGDFQYLHIDPNTKQVLSSERIGNLPEIRGATGIPFDPALEPIKGPFGASNLKTEFKIGQGLLALLTGVKFKEFDIPVRFNQLGEILDTKTVQQVFARNNFGLKALGINSNAPIFQNLDKFTNVRGALRNAAGNGLVIGTALVAVDDLMIGLEKGLPSSEIVANVAVDSAIAGVAGLAGAAAGALTFPFSPGANILVGVAVSTGVSLALTPIAEKLQLKKALASFLESTNFHETNFTGLGNYLVQKAVSPFQSPSVERVPTKEGVDRFLIEAMQRDFNRRNYAYFF